MKPIRKDLVVDAVMSAPLVIATVITGAPVLGVICAISGVWTVLSTFKKMKDLK